MQIEVIPELGLTAADDAGIGQLLGAAFDDMQDDGYDGRSYYKQRHHLRVVGREGDQIIGHIALLFRAIRLGSRIIPIIGLAEVATHSTRQGQGVASALLKEAIRQSSASLADFIVLFGDHPIYAKHGFQQRRNPLRYVVMDDVQTHKIITRVDDALMILPLRDVLWAGDQPVDLMGHLF